MNVQVNGGSAQTVNLSGSASWNIVWTDQTFTVNLNAGSNTIRIQGIGGGSCRQDRICITGGNSGCTTPNPPQLSANPSSINSGSSSTLSATNCSGTISWSNGLGSSASPTVSPTSTTTYTATCTVNGCTSSAANVTVTVNGTPPSGFSQCIEAESSNGDGPITSDPLASNGNTRGAENNYNHYVDYVVTNVPAQGTYYVKLTFYSTGNPVVNVQVNGGSGQTVNLAGAGTWNIVSVQHVIPVTLNAGSNTIRIQGTGGQSCRQDRICVNNDANARIGMKEMVLETDPDNSFVVSPNPNTGSFEVEFYLEKSKKAVLSVMDVKGVNWFKKSLTGKGKHKEKVILDNSVSGTFLVQLITETGVEVKKFVVVK